MKTPTKPITVEESSGNVFEDLGLSNPQGRLLKAELAHRICQVIEARGLSQAKAAKVLGLDHERGNRRAKFMSCVRDETSLLLQGKFKPPQKPVYSQYKGKRLKRHESRIQLGEVGPIDLVYVAR